MHPGLQRLDTHRALRDEGWWLAGPPGYGLRLSTGKGPFLQNGIPGGIK